MKPKFNFWLEKDGEVALSIWRVKLLEAVGEAGGEVSGQQSVDRLGTAATC